MNYIGYYQADNTLAGYKLIGPGFSNRRAFDFVTVKDSSPNSLYIRKLN